MKLLAYTIGGQTIGIDIQTWNDSMLSGNTAFLAIPDTGSTPTDYVDITSFENWDQFGGGTTLSYEEIRSEIGKLIPSNPTEAQIQILRDWNLIFESEAVDVQTGRFWQLTGTTAVFDETLRVNGKLYAEWMKYMHSASRAVVCRIDDTDAISGNNVGGLVVLNPSGGDPYSGGTATEYWIGVDSGGVPRAGFDGDLKPLTRTYGTEYQLESSLAEDTTSSNSPITKMTLTTPDLSSGTYKATVGWIGNGSAPNSDIIFDVTLNDTPQGTNSTMNIEPKDAQSHFPYVRIFYLSLSGVNDIALRYWSENGNTVSISDATIELIRVE